MKKELIIVQTFDKDGFLTGYKVNGELVRCKDCKYFDLDHFENVRGLPLIVAHEICNRWGNGCKTDTNGFCFMGERGANDGDVGSDR